MEKLRWKIARWLNYLACLIDPDFERDACECCGSLKVTEWDSEGTPFCLKCWNEFTRRNKIYEDGLDKE
jgi:hypothetical protein